MVGELKGSLNVCLGGGLCWGNMVVRGVRVHRRNTQVVTLGSLADARFAAVCGGEDTVAV